MQMPDQKIDLYFLKSKVKYIRPLLGAPKHLKDKFGPINQFFNIKNEPVNHSQIKLWYTPSL